MKPILRLLLTGSFIWYFGEGLLGPLYAVFAERVGGDILQITWAWAVYLIVGGVCSIYFARLADKKIDVRKVLMAGYALNTIGTFGYLLVDSPARLFIVQGILGLSSALATPTWDALYSKYEDKGKRVSQWGIADGGPDIITGVAVIIGGLIVNFYSFTALFIIMGTIQIIATAVQAKILFKNKRSHLSRG